VKKNIESDFYANESPNDDLESEIYKGSWRCSYAQTSFNFLEHKNIQKEKVLSNYSPNISEDHS